MFLHKGWLSGEPTPRQNRVKDEDQKNKDFKVYATDLTYDEWAQAFIRTFLGDVVMTILGDLERLYIDAAEEGFQAGYHVRTPQGLMIVEIEYDRLTGRTEATQFRSGRTFSKQHDRPPLFSTKRPEIEN